MTAYYHDLIEHPPCLDLYIDLFKHTAPTMSFVLHNQPCVAPLDDYVFESSDKAQTTYDPIEAMDSNSSTSNGIFTPDSSPDQPDLMGMDRIITAPGELDHIVSPIYEQLLARSWISPNELVSGPTELPTQHQDGTSALTQQYLSDALMSSFSQATDVNFTQHWNYGFDTTTPNPAYIQDSLAILPYSYETAASDGGQLDGASFLQPDYGAADLQLPTILEQQPPYELPIWDNSIQIHDIGSSRPGDLTARVEVLKDLCMPQGVTALDSAQHSNEEPIVPSYTLPQMTTSASTSHRRHNKTKSVSERISAAGVSTKPKRQRNLRPAIATVRQTGTSSAGIHQSTSAVSPDDIVNKSRPGGRRGGLSDEQKENAKLMRDKGSCWPCALQRIKCDKNHICKVCAERSLRSGPHILGCDRTALPEMISTFISITMSRTHDRAALHNFIRGNVAGWIAFEGGRGRQVDLTVGYGPSFPVELHEFEPAMNEIVCQIQWVDDGQGVFRDIKKLSPPLGIKALDSQSSPAFDDLLGRLEEFVDGLIHSDLEDFQETYCAEQRDEPFRASLMRILCTLYKEVPNATKVSLLQVSPE